MKLRAVITIDIEAADFVEAAMHQRRIESLLQPLTEPYPDAALTFRERRSTRRSRVAAIADIRPLPRPSGKLRTYVG